MSTLLFLHGWGGNDQSFAPISQYFARDYQVLVPNLPCPPATVYTLDDYARDVQEFLRAHHVTQCCVVAHSFGARVVAVLQAQNPTLFSRIVITGGAGLRPRGRLWWWLRVRWYRLRKKLWGHATGGSADYRGLSPAGKQTFQNVVNRDLTALIRQIRVPTLIIHGARDTATPLWMARRWARLIPHSRLIIYPDQDHFAYLHCAARFIKDVAAFLTDGAA